MAVLLTIAVIVAVSIGYLTYTVFLLREERRRRQEILERAVDLVRGAAPLPEGRQGMVGWLTRMAQSTAARFGEAVKPKEATEISKIKASLTHAGLRHPKAVELYWGIKVGAALTGLLLGLMLALSGRVPPQFRLGAVVGCAGAMFYLPGIILGMRVTKRQRAIQKGLPDALDLLVVCVEAGMGLDAAIYRVCLDLAPKEPILSSELRLLTLELRAGKSRREALKNLANRIGLEDVNSLVALLIQADMFGTSVATTLRVYADAMRTKRFQRAEELAAKLPVKLLLPLVFFIFPTLLIVILGPAALRLMQMFAATNK